MQLRSERIQTLENSLQNEAEKQKLLVSQISKLEKQLQDKESTQQNKDRLFAEYQVQHQKLLDSNSELQEKLLRTEQKYEKTLADYSDFHNTKLKLEDQITQLQERNGILESNYKNIPEKIETLESSNTACQAALAEEKAQNLRSQEQVAGLQKMLQEIESRLPIAQQEYQNLVEKDKLLIQENKVLAEKNATLVNINSQLLARNQELAASLDQASDEQEQQEMKKNIFYQKKVNEYESRILLLTEDNCRLTEQIDKLNSTVNYLNQVQSFFDGTGPDAKATAANAAHNEKMLTEKVKILAKQLEQHIRNRTATDARIAELEEFIMMLADERQDASKALQYLQLGNLTINKMDWLAVKCENCGNVFRPRHAPQPGKTEPAQ